MRESMILLICLAASGCSNNPHQPTVNDPVAQGQYNIYLSSDTFGITQLKGDNVGTSWNADTGGIFLDTDESNEPLGTLTLTIGPVFTTFDGVRSANVLAAVLSKTDVRVGTAAELNAKMYALLPSEANQIINVEIGPNYVKGYLNNIVLRRVIVHPDDILDIAAVAGEFTAIKN